VTSFDNAFLELQAVQQHTEAIKENSARTARLYVTFQTTGAGQLVPPAPVMFELPMFSEPAVSHGFALARAPDRRYFRLPMVSAGVLRWERNNRGYYVGAYLFFRVEVERLVDPPPLPPAPVINHHFVFTAPAYKAMSQEINEAVMQEAIEPLVPPVM
jgi:hypothetical protein